MITKRRAVLIVTTLSITAILAGAAFFVLQSQYAQRRPNIDWKKFEPPTEAEAVNAAKQFITNRIYTPQSKPSFDDTHLIVTVLDKDTFAIVGTVENVFNYGATKRYRYRCLVHCSHIEPWFWQCIDSELKLADEIPAE